MGDTVEVLLPDIGDFEDVDVAELLVSPGDRVEAETSLIVLESDKASMEIPSPVAGVVKALKVAVGDKVSHGSLIALIETSGEARAAKPEPPERKPPEPERKASPPERKPAPEPPAAVARSAAPAPRAEPETEEALETSAELEPPDHSDLPPPLGGIALPHASPSVRRLGRELGADLRLVPGSGPKGRILKEDVQGYVKSMIAKGTAAGVPIAGVAVAAPVEIDFAKFGPIETEPLARIRKLSAANLHRSWVTVPHVTQHDEADITDLDAFRRDMKPEAEAKGVKLTFLPFVLKACVAVLREQPRFNASLDHTGENLILKRYFHIGVAVDTPNGLVVPVVRDADRKGLLEIAAELAELSARARARKLMPGDMQGGSFSISSLGGIGGTFFTPIVNHPEVAVLGVGRMDWRPVHRDGGFVPRLVLPLSLSYDHRVIDGADAARFTTRLSQLLSDLRRLILSGMAEGGALHADVLVIGAGPGGYTAAFRAADLGKRVVLVERYPALGGVCLNVGCIPSKALLHVAEVVSEARDLADAGVAFGAPAFDFAKLREHKDRIVGRLGQGLAKLAVQRKVEVVTGVARFADPHTAVVEADGSQRRVSFDHAILAVGSRVARLPGLPDDPRVLDSTSALELDGGARRLLVIGGGIIGLEMAAVYHATGSEVTIVELLPQLMTGADPDLLRPLVRRIQRRYAGIHLETKVETVEALAEGLRVSFAGAKAPAPTLFDRVLVAVGRRPNGDGIAAERAGVKVDARGFIPIDDRCRTNVPHIFAIGDVAGEPLLAHKASHQGVVAAEVIAGLPATFEAFVPSVAYTDPEIAWVGLTETRAVEEGIAFEKAVVPWSASGRALGTLRSDGITKLLYEPESLRLLGAGIAGPSAGDLIAEATLALELRADVEDLALTIHPHPTLSETLAFAAQMGAGTVTDLYAPKKRRTKAER